MNRFNDDIFSRGVRCMLVATLFFTLMHTLIKELKSVHVFQIVFFRSLITWILCIYFIRKHKVYVWGYNKAGLILRATLGVVSMILFFVTIQNMPLGSSVSIKYLSPIFTAIFGAFFLGERVKGLQWLLFAFALLGIYIMKEFDIRIESMYLLLGIVGAMAGGGVYTVIRKMGQSEHYLVVIHYFMLLSTGVSGVGMLYFWQSMTMTEWMMIVAIGVLGYYAQVYMTQSFRYEIANRVAPIKYMEVIYSMIIGWFWFKEGYTFFVFIGMTLVLASMFFTLTLTSKQN